MSYEYVYTVVRDEDGGAVLDFVKFPEIVCEIGDSDLEHDKVRVVAFDAVKNALQARVDYNDEIPESDKGIKGEDVGIVVLSPLDILKLSLYSQFRASGYSKAEFAKRTSLTPTGLARVFDLYHASRFDVLIDIFDKLGYKVSTNIDVKRLAG